MKKKNKILSTLLFGSLIAPCIFMMSACAETPLEHKAVTEWSTDETYHWHACTVEDCKDTYDKGEHTYDQTTNLCKCGKAKAGSVAIIDGTAVETLTSDAVKNKTVTLLADYTETAIELDGTTIEAVPTENGIVLKAVVKNGNVTLENINTQEITVDNDFAGSLVFEGGYLQAKDNSTYAFLRGYEGKQADYTFRNMKVSTGTEKGIKIQRAKSITIDKCTFDGTNLLTTTGGDINQTRSLSAIDITLEGTNDSEFAKTNITITNCIFKNIRYGVDGDDNETTHLDTAGAIKIKNQMKENGGIGKVTITGNKFTNVCRDIVIGKAKDEYFDYQTRTWTTGSAAWTVKNNTSTFTTETVKNVEVKTEVAEKTKIGKMQGGCAIFDIGDAYPNTEAETTTYPYSVQFAE